MTLLPLLILALLTGALPVVLFLLTQPESKP
jgi:hypothetical protein